MHPRRLPRSSLKCSRYCTPPCTTRTVGAPPVGRRALPAGRLARLGATPDFHHGLLTNFTNPDVAEGDPVAMILQADVAAHRASVARVVLELARFHPLFPVVAPQLVLDDLHAVQPMLDVAAFDEDARLVP